MSAGTAGGVTSPVSGGPPRPDVPPPAVLEQVLAGLRWLDAGRGQHPGERPAQELSGDAPTVPLGVVTP
ncbi:hypothetical protein RIF23_01485 [Lipingzhangella sp. LS1_29]|uniref:Uncharacterized protein n=1 Tax=Lipingzhangella rawalii TaxID=2055835 RepID=A0ABU2H0X9_9ACTN|nr:hypothetical protein [Lipingzhangella rawalii]